MNSHSEKTCRTCKHYYPVNRVCGWMSHALLPFWAEFVDRWIYNADAPVECKAWKPKGQIGSCVKRRKVLY